MKRLAIIGSGDLGQLIAHHAKNDAGFEIVGFFDDFATPGSETKYGRILGKLSQIEESYQQKAFDFLSIAVGYKHLEFREQCLARFDGSIPLAKIIHSSCVIDSTAVIEAGCFLLPGCVIDTEVKIGKNSVLNTACCIAHDSKIGENCFLSPRVAVAGFVEIGPKCFLGINTTVIDNIKIVAGSQTGAGAVVIKNIDEAGLYLGIPAKKVSR